jgi:membrane fusion protein (multidrug efflux system)
MNRAIVSVIFLSVAFFSCQQKKEVPNLPTPVNLYTVTSESVFYYDQFPGTTQALNQVDVRPQVQGYVTKIFFKEGTFVKKGEKLYEIDQRLYTQNLDAEKANLKVAQGNMQQAQQDADRYVYLNKENAIAKQTLDHALIALQNAKNQVQAAEQAVKTASTNLNYSIITAPFDGTIGFSLVKIGDLVTVGTTIMNTVSTNNPMAVDFLINEKQLGHYEDILTGSKPQPDSLFTILLPDGTPYPQTGKISIIDRAVDPQTGAIRVRLVFPNDDAKLKVGLSCQVRVHNLDVKPQMVIPNRAVIEQMGEYFVYIAKDTVMAAKNGKDEDVPKHEDNSKDKEDPNAKALRSFQVKVQLGQIVGPNIVVKSGIKVGDKIVLDGVQSLHDGSRITLGKPKGAKGGKGATDAAGAGDNNTSGHSKHG